MENDFVRTVHNLFQDFVTHNTRQLVKAYLKNLQVTVEEVLPNQEDLQHLIRAELHKLVGKMLDQLIYHLLGVKVSSWGDHDLQVNQDGLAKLADLFQDDLYAAIKKTPVAAKLKTLLDRRLEKFLAGKKVRLIMKEVVANHIEYAVTEVLEKLVVEHSLETLQLPALTFASQDEDHETDEDHCTE